MAGIEGQKYNYLLLCLFSRKPSRESLYGPHQEAMRRIILPIYERLHYPVPKILNLPRKQHQSQLALQQGSF